MYREGEKSLPSSGHNLHFLFQIGNCVKTTCCIVPTLSLLGIYSVIVDQESRQNFYLLWWRLRPDLQKYGTGNHTVRMVQLYNAFLIFYIHPDQTFRYIQVTVQEVSDFDSFLSEKETNDFLFDFTAAKYGTYILVSNINIMMKNALKTLTGTLTD